MRAGNLLPCNEFFHLLQIKIKIKITNSKQLVHLAMKRIIGVVSHHSTESAMTQIPFILNPHADAYMTTWMDSILFNALADRFFDDYPGPCSLTRATELPNSHQRQFHPWPLLRKVKTKYLWLEFRMLISRITCNNAEEEKKKTPDPFD